MRAGGDLQGRLKRVCFATKLCFKKGTTSWPSRADVGLCGSGRSERRAITSCCDCIASLDAGSPKRPQDMARADNADNRCSAPRDTGTRRFHFRTHFGAIPRRRRKCLGRPRSAPAMAARRAGQRQEARGLRGLARTSGPCVKGASYPAGCPHCLHGAWRPSPVSAVRTEFKHLKAPTGPPPRRPHPRQATAAS